MREMPTDLIANEAELKRYLYSEMSEDEHAEMEERLFLDDELFIEAVDLENRLVDSYVKEGLPREERARFELALSTQPERQQKVANALALQEFIAEERPQQPATITVAERSVWQKISAFFVLGSPSLGYGMAGLLLLLTFLSVFLVVDNRRKGNELARLQGEQQAIDELEGQLVSAREREGELQSLVDNEREASGDLGEELQAERTRRERIEIELAKLKKENDRQPPEGSRPIVATLVLAPLSGRGGDEVKDVRIPSGVKRVSMQLALPDGPSLQGRYSISLNTRQVARNLAPRTGTGGKRSLTISLVPKDIDEGLNRISVTGSNGEEVGKYSFNVEKQ